MSLQRQLKRWTEAGLIRPEQAEQIQAFEKRDRQSSLIYALAGLAGLAMAIGVVSIVAANWGVIPGRIKLGIDLCCLAALGYGSMRWHEQGPGWLGEAASVLSYGLVLASIALVGQVYQLGGNTAVALGLWSALTFPLMAYGRSRGLALVWLLGLQTTYAVGLIELVDVSHRLQGLAVAAAAWPPLALLALGGSRRCRRVRPELAAVAVYLGWSELVLVASAGTLAFYGRPHFTGTEGLLLGALVSLAATCGLIATVPADNAGGRMSRWLLLGAFAVGQLPSLVPHGEVPVAAALSFIALWYVVALTAHRSALRWALHYATAAIGIRLLIVYFEVFGSLLDTGLGLVTGGLLTLLLIWFWARKRREFDRELGAIKAAVSK